MNQFFLWQLSTKLLGRPQVQTFRALSKDSRNKTVDQKLTFSYFRCGQNDTFIPKVRFSIFYVGNFKRIKVTFLIFGTKSGNCSDLIATIITLTHKKQPSIDVLDSLVMSFAFLVDDFFDFD